MKLAKLLAVTILCLLGSAAWSAPNPAKGPSVDLKGKALKQVLDELLPGMGAPDIAARKDPQQQWQEICLQAGAPGHEATRAEACKLMAGKLGPQTAGPARVWLLKQLQYIGRGECVEAVAALLDDQDDLVRDAAVRCLAANPAPEATAKLVQKLPGAKVEARVALLNALAYRADPDAVPALAKELTRKDAGPAVAAARALGKIATPEATRALAAARAKAPEQVRSAIADAELRCAERLLHQGKTAEAAAIYRELHRPQEPRAIRLAALQGVLQCAGDEAGNLILDIFHGDDTDVHAVATGAIREISPAALKTLVAGQGQLPVPSQAVVLGALAARGDRTQLPVALAAARSDNEALQEAGIRALGKLGDASVVPMLIDKLFADKKPAPAARDSLTRLYAPGVNEKLLALLQSEKDPRRHVELVGVLTERRVVAAVPLLLKDARGQDATLRKGAMAALGQLAEPGEVGEMIQALFQAAKGPEREQAEKAVVAVCSKGVAPQHRADPVLAVYGSVGKAEKIVLLPLLGRLGGSKARTEVRSALASGDSELADAATHALYNWPDRSVSSDLLKLAEDASNAQRRRAALQALVRVNSNPDEGANTERFALLKRAMELTPGIEERKWVLRGLSSVRDVATLRYVLPYLDDKDLAQEACRTVVELAHHKGLREPNRSEFGPALDRVIVLCKDQAVVDRAKRYKQGY